jgi:hypothetical protein
MPSLSMAMPSAYRHSWRLCCTGSVLPVVLVLKHYRWQILGSRWPQATSCYVEALFLTWALGPVKLQNHFSVANDIIPDVSKLATVSDCSKASADATRGARTAEVLRDGDTISQSES